MTDVFISYSRADKERVAQLAAAIDDDVGSICGLKVTCRYRGRAYSEDWLWNISRWRMI